MNTPQMKEIVVPYGSRTCLTFALALGKMLELRVVVLQRKKGATLGLMARTLGEDAEQFLLASDKAVREDITEAERLVGYPAYLATDEGEPFEARLRDGLVVTTDSQLIAREDLVVCVPKGRPPEIKDSIEWMLPVGVRAGASRALSVIQKLFTNVGQDSPRLCFYHSSWQGGEEAGKSALRGIVGMLNGSPISICMPILEYAPTITFGVVKTAIERGSSMIVTARSPQTHQGHHADQILHISPVPVIIVGSRVNV